MHCKRGSWDPHTVQSQACSSPPSAAHTTRARLTCRPLPPWLPTPRPQLLHELGPGEQAAIERFVDEVEGAWGLRFPPGFNPDLRFMAHVWEPLR